MRKIIINTACILLFSLSQLAQAETIFTCVPVKMKSQNKNFILPGPTTAADAEVYFFKNSGKEGVWIDHPTKKSMSAGWSSYVRAGNWSSLLLNRKNFEISCKVIHPGNVESLDCAQAIEVCMPKEVTFKTPPKGTYWLAEDKPWSDIVKDVTRRGVTLK